MNNQKKFKRRGIRQSYSTGPYNKYNDGQQWIRVSQGCPNNCPFCYEPVKRIIFRVPKIIRRDVRIMDMNLLSQSGALEIIKEFGQKRIDKKVIYYQLVCGIDWRFLTQEIATALKESRFKHIRLAWDYGYENQFKIRDALRLLFKAGYRAKDITIFMICNWEIDYDICFKKLYLCAIWGVKVADCYFDGQTSPNIKPIGWTVVQIKSFRRNVRKHNQLINFNIDPEITKEKNNG